MHSRAQVWRERKIRGPWRLRAVVSPRLSGAAMLTHLVERYLPAQFLSRIPIADRPWRGRMVLLAWALGYPLAMAWSLVMLDDQDDGAWCREMAARVDDDELVSLLEATAYSRGDGSEFVFVRPGP